MSPTEALLSLLLLYSPPVMATTVSNASVPMPAEVVLIVCRTEADGPNDQNSKFTNSENLRWATEHSMMVCKRQVVQLFDRAEAMGADPQPFNAQRCQRSAIMLGAEWNQQHRSSPYRVWRVACPVPTVDTNTGRVLSWTLPDCGGYRGTVICELDTAI